MCCDLRTHVIVIAIIGITFSGLGGILWVYMNHLGIRSPAGFVLHWAQFLWVGTGLSSDIWCLIGAIKRDKYRLIPFMIVNSILLFLLIGGTLFILWFIWAASGDMLQRHHKKRMLITVIPFSTSLLSLHVYFLIIVGKFYKRLSTGEISTQQTGMSLQP